MVMIGILKNLFDFEREETRGEVLFFRLFEAVVIALAIHKAWTWALYLPRIQEVILPAGIAHHVDLTIMFASGTGLANASLISFCLLMAYFRLWRYAYFASVFLLHIQFAARYSLGKIPHSSYLVGMSVLALALAFVLYQNRREIHRFALGFLLFFVGFGYLLSASCKLIGTGIHWSDGRHLWLWLAEKGVDVYSATGHYAPNFLQMFVLDHYLLATGMLAVGLLTELAAIGLWWKNFRPYVATLLIGMHVGVYFAMNILFLEFIIIVALIGYRWDRILESITETFVPSRPVSSDNPVL